MKKRVVNFFNWVSKHLKLLTIILGALVAIIPFFSIKVTLPIWALLLIFLVPFYLLYLYNWFFVQKRKYKPGDTVGLKGTTIRYLVTGYEAFSKTNVVCVSCTTNTPNSLHHQDILQLYP